MPSSAPSAASRAPHVLRGARTASLAQAAGVQPRFDLSSPEGGPFPSNRWTTVDCSQNTGLRVNLPKPDCAVRPSDCADIDVLNTLDGFNLQPRISIPFTGADRSDERQQLERLPGPLPDFGVTGINQIAWELAANTLHVESDQLLRQHTSYILVVTTEVRDATGDRIELRVLPPAHARGMSELVAGFPASLRLSDVAVASIFTTQSATSLLEQVRRQIKASTPRPADFVLGAGGERTVFPLRGVTSILFSRQTGTAPTFAVSPNRDAVPGRSRHDRVRRVRRARLRDAVEGDSRRRHAAPACPPCRGRTVSTSTSSCRPGPLPRAGGPSPSTATASPTTRTGARSSSPARWRGAGSRRSRSTSSATAFGPLGTLIVNRAAGGPVVLPAGGRGIDQDGNGAIDSTEGVNAAPPQTLVGSRDGLRQTVIDLMSLVREIEVGMDVDGNGTRDLDPSRISYFGQSFGGIYGTKFLAVEPNVRRASPNVPGGAIVEIARLSPAFRGLVWLSLVGRTPPLIEPARPFQFNENMPLRNLPPLVDTVPGASAIQQLLEWTEWASQAGNPVAYAVHLRAEPLSRRAGEVDHPPVRPQRRRPSRTRRRRRSSAPAGCRTGRRCSGTTSRSRPIRRSRRTRTRS